MKNNSGLEFTDISSEMWRVYDYGNHKIRISEPTHLNVSKSGGHRILDRGDVSHYIPSGWIHLYWKVSEGEPNFVK